MYNLGDDGSHQINSINIHSGETVISHFFSVVNTLCVHRFAGGTYLWVHHFCPEVDSYLHHGVSILGTLEESISIVEFLLARGREGEVSYTWPVNFLTFAHQKNPLHSPSQNVEQSSGNKSLPYELIVEK